jgi:hypothetical protein
MRVLAVPWGVFRLKTIIAALCKFNIRNAAADIAATPSAEHFLENAADVLVWRAATSAVS